MYGRPIGRRPRSSAGPPHSPARSTPASKCGSLRSAAACSSHAAAAPSPAGCGPAPPDATTSATTISWAAWDARPRQSPALCSASSRAGSPPCATAHPWSSHWTTPPPSGMGRMSKPPASTTTPPLGRPGRSSSTATSLGSVSLSWAGIHSGRHRPADPLPSVHPGQGHRLDGGVLWLGVPHQAGAGRCHGPVAGRTAGQRWSAGVGRDRRGLRQAAVPQGGAQAGGRR